MRWICAIAMTIEGIALVGILWWLHPLSEGEIKYVSTMVVANRAGLLAVTSWRQLW